MYYRGSHGILLVFDVTSQESFDNVRGWMQSIESNCDGKAVNKILIANKADLVNKRVVTMEQGQQLAKEFGISYLETSAKDNVNVTDAFMQLATVICARLRDEKDRVLGGSEVAATIAVDGGAEAASGAGGGCC